MPTTSTGVTMFSSLRRRPDQDMRSHSRERFIEVGISAALAPGILLAESAEGITKPQAPTAANPAMSIDVTEGMVTLPCLPDLRADVEIPIRVNALRARVRASRALAPPGRVISAKRDRRRPR